MSIANKKILLIAYQFCPKGQIGTRRWSKFAKYLARKGFEVHVLCAQYPYKDKINWCHDVENNPRIVIHRIPARYPAYLLRPDRNFWIKLFDRLLSRSLYYFDKSQHWGSALIPAAVKLIREEGIVHVIVTGPPFPPVYQAAIVKKKLPDIFLVLDYRDPWIPWVEKRSLLDRVRNSVRRSQETAALAAADKVLFVIPGLKEDYAKAFPAMQDKFLVLYNGYDEDDFRHLPEHPVIEPFHFVYTGSITRERAVALEYIVRAVAELDDDFFRQEMRINIFGYGYNPPQFQEKTLQDLSDQLIRYCGVVPQSEVFEVLQRHEFCLSINAPEHTNSIAAKTFDYMGLKKKIFLISLPGELSHLLDQAGQYVATYSVASIKEALLRMKEEHLLGETGAAKELFLKFECAHLTDTLISYLV